MNKRIRGPSGPRMRFLFPDQLAVTLTVLMPLES